MDLNIIFCVQGSKLWQNRGRLMTGMEISRLYFILEYLKHLSTGLHVELRKQDFGGHRCNVGVAPPAFQQLLADGSASLPSLDHFHACSLVVVTAPSAVLGERCPLLRRCLSRHTYMKKDVCLQSIESTIEQRYMMRSKAQFPSCGPPECWHHCRLSGSNRGKPLRVRSGGTA